VSRFVFLSTIGVHGSSTTGHPITETSPFRPHDAYSTSKLAGEETVRTAGLEHTIIRPPLVYGPGAPGNLWWLCKALSKGVPMPLANARGERSMVSVRNLCSFIARCLGPGAEGQTFVIAEENPFRTCDMARELSLALERRPLFYPVPVGFVRSMASMVGRQRIADRLFGSLIVDSSFARSRLNWSSPVDPREDLVAMGQEFASQ
jgi:nucleoside-diphosphate-sugar epimerase